MGSGATPRRVRAAPSACFWGVSFGPGFGGGAWEAWVLRFAQDDVVGGVGAVAPPSLIRVAAQSPAKSEGREELRDGVWGDVPAGEGGALGLLNGAARRWILLVCGVRGVEGSVDPSLRSG